MYNSHAFLMCVPLPLAMALGGVVTLVGGVGGGREAASAVLAIVGGLAVAIAYLLRYLPVQRTSTKTRTRVIFLSRLVWISWFAGLAVLWLRGRG